MFPQGVLALWLERFMPLPYCSMIPGWSLLSKLCRGFSQEHAVQFWISLYPFTYGTYRHISSWCHFSPLTIWTFRFCSSHVIESAISASPLGRWIRIQSPYWADSTEWRLVCITAAKTKMPESISRPGRAAQKCPRWSLIETLKFSLFERYVFC